MILQVLGIFKTTFKGKFQHIKMLESISRIKILFEEKKYKEMYTDISKL